MTIDWTFQLYEQLDWQWREHMRPRWDGLTDEEYFWEPVPGMWNVRPRGTSKAPIAAGSGDFTCDYAWPEPDPAPATTIAWRLAHLQIGVFGQRAASHFGGPAISYDTYDYPGDAATALSRLDAAYAAWAAGVRALDPEGLARPIGQAEGPFAAEPMAQLILHINREALHHGAEISLLRDLYRWRD
jgi:hypothetical protein